MGHVSMAKTTALLLLYFLGSLSVFLTLVLINTSQHLPVQHLLVLYSVSIQFRHQFPAGVFFNGIPSRSTFWSRLI